MGWSTGLFRRVILAVMTPLAGLADVRRRSFKCVAVLIVVGLVAGTLVGGLTGVGQPRSFHAASGRSDRSVGTAHQAHLVSTAGEAGQYVPVQAVRICDTRPSNPSGLSGAAAQCNGSGNSGEPIGAGSTLTLNATGTFGSTTIPSSAYAVVVTITVATNTAPTWLMTYAAGTTRPWPASDLNDTSANSVVNNQVTATVGAGGQITVYNAAGSTNINIDLDGYYSAPGAGAGYNALAAGPTRICDTTPNNPSGLSGGAAQCNGASNAGKTLGTSRNGGSETLTVQVTGLTNTAGQLISPPPAPPPWW